jgi:rRNA maturation endonuclease Nob1
MGEIVYAKDFEGYVFSLFGAPKWDIQCGKCGQWFRKRIVLCRIPYAICDHCGSTNKLRGVTCG